MVGEAGPRRIGQGPCICADRLSALASAGCRDWERLRPSSFNPCWYHRYFTTGTSQAHLEHGSSSAVRSCIHPPSRRAALCARSLVRLAHSVAKAGALVVQRCGLDHKLRVYPDGPSQI